MPSHRTTATIRSHSSPPGVLLMDRLTRGIASRIISASNPKSAQATSASRTAVSVALGKLSLSRRKDTGRLPTVSRKNVRSNSSDRDPIHFRLLILIETSHCNVEIGWDRNKSRSGYPARRTLRVRRKGQLGIRFGRGRRQRRFAYLRNLDIFARL